MQNVVSIDLSHFDFSSVSRFNKMFYGCSSLLSINLTNFTSLNFINTPKMFEGCISLISINLTSTKKIVILNGENMFKNCSSLRLIELSNYELSIVTNSTDMFNNVNNLKYIKLMDVGDKTSIIKKSPLNEINDLIVCQNKNLITNPKARKYCCDFNIETNECENDYYVSLYFNQDSYFINNYDRGTINYLEYNDEIISGQKEIYIKSGSKLDVHYVYPIYDSQIFFNCEYDRNMDNVVTVDLTHFNFSLITKMNYTFYKCGSIQPIIFPNSSEINQIINMSKLFSGCNSLKSLNLSNVITSNTKDLSYMFDNCTSLKLLDISNFNFTNNDVTDMFRNINNLKYVDLSNVTDDGKYISQSHLNEIDELFVCQKKNIIPNPNVYNICCDYNIELDKCDGDNYIIIYFAQDVNYKNGFKNELRNNIGFINYENSTYLDDKELNIKANSKVEIHFNTPINNLESFFYPSLDDNMNYVKSIDFSNFDASLVTNFRNMFGDCKKLKYIDFTNFNTSNAIDMSEMFDSCTSLSSLDLSHFNTSKVKRMDRMFRDCSSLLALDLYNFSFENVTSSDDIFKNLMYIRYINIFNVKDKNNIISGSLLNRIDSLIVCQRKKGIITNKRVRNDCCEFDIVSRTCKSNYISLGFFKQSFVSINNNQFLQKIDYIMYSGEMFINESFNVNSSNDAELHFIYPISDLSEFFVLNENGIVHNLKSVNFSHFNSKYITNMSKIFYECYRIETIDFTNFNTSNVLDMSYMFHHCDSLEFLDLSGFDMSKVTSVDNMFYYCYVLKMLDFSHFSSESIVSSINMFDNIEILGYINLYYAKDENNILSGSYVNEVNDLIACQKEKILTNKNITNACCNYNITSKKCEFANYIIVYYGQNDTEYNSSFINEYRSNISFIIYENSRFSGNEGFTIKEGTKIQIHFTSRLTSLESFFDKRYDENVVNIISIDFSYFDSSLLTSIDYLFYGCSSLQSIDLTNVISPSITRMDYMFNDCSALKSLNLSNLNSSSLTSANSLFKNCTSLKFLDISSFSMKNLKEGNEMFNNLTSLKYISLYDIETSDIFLNETNKELNNIDDYK